MSRKYIKQIDKENFVYAGNTLAEYDVEIIHDLTENSVSGTTSGFDISYSSGNIYCSFTYQWLLNNGEPFISDDGKLNVLSLHMMSPTKQYFKPWICVGLVQRDNTALTSVTDTQNFVITPTMLGGAITDGTYYFEVRFIGKRGIFPIQEVDTLALPTPTPTMTPTPTATPGLSPTPTPTPTPSGYPGGNNLADIGDSCRTDGCTSGTVLRVFLDDADYAIYVANSYTFSGAGGGAPTTCTLIARNSSGNPITASCFLDTNFVSWKLTSGNFTYHTPQC